MKDEKYVIQKPAPLPYIETSYGFLHMKETLKTSDGRVLEVKKTPLFELWRKKA